MMASQCLDSTLQQLLSRFGYTSWRSDAQREAAVAVAGGGDVMACLPTGGGKTLIYSLPALMTSVGVTVCLSPLIALMDDQARRLCATGALPAAAWHSEMSPAAERKLLKDLDAVRPATRVILCSPERALSSAGQRVLKILAGKQQLTRFVVDEAHCINQWGHDFRPSYSRLVTLRESFPGVPIVGLTATATPFVLNQVCTQLGMAPPPKGSATILRASVDRPELTYEVVYHKTHYLDDNSRLLHLTKAIRSALGLPVPAAAAAVGGVKRSRPQPALSASDLWNSFGAPLPFSQHRLF